MARALSLAARIAMHAQETGEVFLVLLKIIHPNLPQPLFFVRDGQSCVSRGQLYIPVPFDFTLPSDTDDEPPQAKITIDNVSRQVTEALRSITTTPDIEVSIVLASTPDVLEYGPVLFQLADLQVNALTVTGTLIYDPITNEQFPCDSYIPEWFPGLFGAANA